MSNLFTESQLAVLTKQQLKTELETARRGMNAAQARFILLQTYQEQLAAELSRRG